MTQRPACAPGPCFDQAFKDLLLLDGAIQAASAIAIFVGLVTAPHEMATARSIARLRPTVQVSPAAIGAAGRGLVAAGTF
jgi:hypothetical protein